MAVIPRSIYRVVEWHLHNVPRLLAESLRKEMPSLLPSGVPVISGGKGRHSDRTADIAMSLADESKWQRWMDCISKTERHFSGSMEQDMARRYYGQNTTVLAVADAMCVDKQTVNRYRDRYVAFLALAAACDGLIDMKRAGA